MLNLVLFGPPGAGKGTQSEKLIRKYNLIHLSTGDLLRSQIAAGTDLGLRAKQLMDQGLLVPDEVVIGMIDYKLHENQATPGTDSTGGFIFDGFPRTVPQAEALDQLLTQYDTRISTMVALVVDDEELIRRLLKRGETSGRPDDQNEGLIRRRVNEYNDKTKPVADYYGQQGKYVSINGIGDIDNIFEAICGEIQKADVGAE
jgi:adenylate kinase